MNATLAQTPLYDWHVAHGGRMVEFAGWSMPLQYTSIVEEHLATRRAAGLFDISHMGRLRFDGPAAAALLDSLVTRDVSALRPQRDCYALVTNEQGGVLDDVVIFHLRDATGGAYYLMVVNAGNREKIAAWVDMHGHQTLEAQWMDVTSLWAMIAVQGPRAIELAGPLVDCDLGSMPYYAAHETEIAGHGGIVSRTGYTGDDGLELIVGSGAARDIWESLIEAGRPMGAVAAGLGCRDTLRLEAGMPLYDHELSEQIDPFQANLSFAVDLDKGAFIGHNALVELSKQSDRPRRIGLELDGKRIARQGYSVLAGGAAVGHVTSGTFSPTLEKPIAMAYVDAAYSQVGTELAVDIRGRAEPARVVKLPFYRRRPKGT